MLVGEEPAENLVLTHTDKEEEVDLPENLDLIPAARKLEGIDQAVMTRSKFMTPADVLRAPLESLRDKYDYIFLDSEENQWICPAAGTSNGNEDQQCRVSNAEAVTRQRRAYLFSMGIEEYREFRPLRCCSADAESIWHQFGDKLNTSNRVLLVSHSNDHQEPDAASVRAILRSIRDLHLGPDDVVFFYFAGHGFSKLGLDYLACGDTIGSDLTSAVTTDEVVSALVSSAAGTRVLILDACRDHNEKNVGSFGESTLKLGQREGASVLIGCSPGGRCQESLALGHGIFTYAMLKAV